MCDKISVLGVNVSNETIQSATQKVLSFVRSGDVTSVFTPNSEMLYEAHTDKAFKDILNTADLIVPDGVGVLIGAKVKGDALKERVAGFDLATSVLNSGEPLKLFLFGAKQESVLMAKANIEKIPNIDVVGVRNGYFKDDETDEIIDEINELGADIVFVCLGFPKQEKWIYGNKHKFKKGVLMGLGGSIDVFAGIAKRAPDIYIKLGIEWLYRLLKEPTRIGRMMNLPKFLLTVIFTKKQ